MPGAILGEASHADGISHTASLLPSSSSLILSLLDPKGLYIYSTHCVL